MRPALVPEDFLVDRNLPAGFHSGEFFLAGLAGKGPVERVDILVISLPKVIVQPDALDLGVVHNHHVIVVMLGVEVKVRTVDNYSRSRTARCHP